MKIVSYNIHKGFNSGNRKFVLEKIREGIRAVGADLLFLQEVQGEHSERRIDDWPTSVQFEYLADEIWPHFAYGKNAVYTAGHHGNAILSKYPISSFENVDISAHPAEERGLLHAAIDIPDHAQPVHAICIHLGLFETWRRSQIERLLHRIESMVPANATLIVAGDFNDWREQVTRILAKKLNLKEAFIEVQGSHARTYPSQMPILKLDRAYYRGADVIRAERLYGPPWSDLSDHTPLLVELIV